MPAKTEPICLVNVADAVRASRVKRRISEIGEHADHGRDQAQAAQQVGVAEGEARMAGRVLQPDAADQQAEAAA